MTIIESSSPVACPAAMLMYVYPVELTTSIVEDGGVHTARHILNSFENNEYSSSVEETLILQIFVYAEVWQGGKTIPWSHCTYYHATTETYA